MTNSSASSAAPNWTHRPPFHGSCGAIHVTYSYFTPEGKSIKHVRINEDWVKQGE